MGIESVGKASHRGRLMWFGCLEGKEENNWIKIMNDEVGRSKGRRRKTWDGVTEKDLRIKGLSRASTEALLVWRTAIS